MQAQPLGRLGRGLLEQDGQDAGDAGRLELTAAGRRQRRGAAADGEDELRRGRVDALERDVDLGAGVGELGELRRVGAQVARGQGPRADRHRAPPRDAVGDGPGHELARAAADVDHPDRRRPAGSPAWPAPR